MERRCFAPILKVKSSIEPLSSKDSHTIVTKLLFVIVSLDVNTNSVRHNRCQPSSVIAVPAFGGTTPRKPMVWRF